MAKNELASDPVTLGQRLEDDVQLYCPLFQRRYVWGRSEIDRLWEDVDTVISGEYERRFLGALVFDDELPPTSGKAGQYWVIDGQQRLTTLVLTVIALASEAQRHGEPGIEIARDLCSQFVVSAKRETRGQPKLRPTIQDTRQFNDVLRVAFDSTYGVNLDVLREAGEPNGDLAAAYRVLQRKVSERTSHAEDGSVLGEEETLERIDQLREVLLDRLEFVEIRLGDTHDPNEVFDRLNNEGVRLGIIDLVRNEVIKRLRDDANAALKLYAEEWLPFEQSFANESAKSGYFFPFALTVDPTITKSRTFNALSRRWASLAQEAEGDPASQTTTIMRDLRRHQAAYNAIQSNQTQFLEPELALRIRRLNDLGAPTVIYPYVIQLVTSAVEEELDTSSMLMSLDVIESFLVRRAVMGIEPTGLHAVFKRLWRDARIDPERVRKTIVSSTVIYPDDQAFRTSLTTGDLYHRKIARYVLSEYERSFTAGDVLEILPPITIDHLVPQELKGAWVNVFTPEQHASLVHTWANLVPLSNPANASKGSKNWQEARALLANETVFATTKHVYDDFPDWTPQAIDARAQNLQGWAIERWPSFSELAS